MEAKRNAKGRFVKGNRSGCNPHGRPPKDPDLVTQCRKLTSLCVENLARILTDSRARNADKLTAATLVLGYSAGRPRISADLNVEYSIHADFLAALRQVNDRAADPKLKTIEHTPEPHRRKQPAPLSGRPPKEEIANVD